MASAATIRRPRGGLEELVRDVCDQITAGGINGEGPWTTQRIANIIHEMFPGSGANPSTGAIGDNLKRWQEIGFAELSAEPPLAFVAYTDEALTVGLTELKARHRKAIYAKRREEKAAAKAQAKAQAEANAPVVEAPAPTGEPGAHGVESWTEPE